MGKRKAGCVPVRRMHDGDWQVMLVQSRWTPAVWLFPKGGVEDGEAGREAAVRETREEAGVVGTLGPKLGTWRFAKAAEQKHKMWLLFVDEVYEPDNKAWKERKKRAREWLSFADARARITEGPRGLDAALVRPELEEMLDAAAHLLESVRGNGEQWKRDLGREGEPDEQAEVELIERD